MPCNKAHLGGFFGGTERGAETGPGDKNGRREREREKERKRQEVGQAHFLKGNIAVVHRVLLAAAGPQGQARKKPLL